MNPPISSQPTQKRRPASSPAAQLRGAWQAGQEPALREFVSELPDVSAVELAELIRIDLDARWGRNDRRQPEEYLKQFPTVAADTELAVDVIYSEYLAREQLGEQPELAEYKQRFPLFAEVLAQQIGLHHALKTFDDGSHNVSDAPHATVGGLVNVSDDPTESETSYEILEQIGSGGMGVVYKALQPALNRLVALKMVRAIDAENPELLARFRSEARVVASLHHPNIVQVYDYGQHEGLPYIAMELTTGGSLANLLDGTPWDPEPAAALIAKLAGAVQFAHEHDVVHRDLKPANVLVVSKDGELDVKITDFGLARFHFDNSSPRTKSFAFLGTPSYMAPEQASGRIRDIGPATDIYSLGAILYELLTGKPPFRGDSPVETIRLLLSSEPVSIHRFNQGIPRDLATICHKCLQSEPNKRYASAAELKADLERYLEGLPIQARPVSRIERCWRWCRRNPFLAAALASVVLLLMGIAAVSLWYSAMLSQELTRTRLAEQAERDANLAAQQQLWNVYLSEATARNSSRKVGQRFAALESIDKARALLGTVGHNNDRTLQLRNAVLSSITLPDFRTVRSIGSWPTNGTACEMSLPANCYVVAVPNGSLNAYRLTDGRPLWTIEPLEPPMIPVLSADGRVAAVLNRQGVTVWKIDSAEPKRLWEAAKVQFLTFTPDGEYAYCSDAADDMRIVRVSDGTTVRKIGKGSARSSFSIHPSGKEVAVRGENSVQVIATDSGDVKTELPRGAFDEVRLAWHPNGKFLAVWDDGSGFSIWNVDTREKTLTIPHRGLPSLLAFSRDGSLLVSQSLWNQRLCVWDVGSGQRLLEVPECAPHACSVGPRNEVLFLTNNGPDAVLSELSPGTCRTLAQSLFAPLGYWHKASVDPTGRIVAYSSGEGLELWDLKTTDRLLGLAIGHCMADFDRTGQLIIGCSNGIFRLPCRVDTTEGRGDQREANISTPHNRTVLHFGPAERLTAPIIPFSFATNKGGDTVVFRDEQGWSLKRADHDANPVRLEPKRDPRRSAVSDDNRFASVANWEKSGATVWDVHSAAIVAELPIGAHGVTQFSPDGRLLAATPDGVTLWNTTDWKCAKQLHALGTTPTGLGIAFSPDSRALAIGQVNGVLRLVDPQSGNDWASFSRSDLNVSSIMAFSDDQRWLVTSSVDEQSPAQVWDLVAMRNELAHRGLDWSSDVLRATTTQSYGEQIEIVIERPELLTSPAAD
jgi:serine/threonine protein kinase/WD40 repeat protein